jgi:hypothetical protein
VVRTGDTMQDRCVVCGCCGYVEECGGDVHSFVAIEDLLYTEALAIVLRPSIPDREEEEGEGQSTRLQHRAICVLQCCTGY